MMPRGQRRKGDVMKAPSPAGFRGGFTLIELLIVVAIIAILAAIAVPNFLEAQTRSKVSRAMSDLRSLGTAVESYAVDHNVYPPNTLTFDSTSLTPLSTPIAYITNSWIPDPFDHRSRVIGRPVVHHEDLEILKGLIQY